MTVAQEVTGPGAVWTAWHLEPSVAMSLFVAATVYAAGLMRSRARRPAVGAARAAGWFVGLAVAGVALLGPLDAAAHDLFSAHMVQHLVLVLVVAPVLVLARPVRVVAAALPPPLRRLSARSARTAPMKTARSPLVAGLAMGVAVAVWHAPALYSAAVRHDVVHGLEHASFVATALLFWAIALGRRDKIGVRAALVFAVFLFSGGLGALLTFAGSVLYPVHGGGPGAWGLSPLTDQQLAGVIMWIPSGVVYVVAFGVLFLSWLRDLENRLPGRPPAPERSADA